MTQRDAVEKTVDDLEDKVLGEVQTQDRNEDADQGGEEPAIERDVDEEDLGTGDAASEQPG